jgi:hypothetical protein
MDVGDCGGAFSPGHMNARCETFAHELAKGKELDA